ncbi:MAG TPA: hypothetical protein VEC36_03285 [Patescibacteria group bacterium]|nr:hypothetical protein [Patescibacteria group bacterium]
MNVPHTFHIPVMGLAFTIDSPLKVARFGITSVVSIVDDILIEKMREYYHSKFYGKFIPITNKEHDFRARRITDYLNLLKRKVGEQMDEMRALPFEKENDLFKYFEMLPDDSAVKSLFKRMLVANGSEKSDLQNVLKAKLQPGDIDVNIMTKLDRVNFSKDDEALPPEFTDALAALRGFAESDLESSIELSAGMNPRLYAYLENFRCFFPDENGAFKKKIIIKVSDFRSAAIQGKFLAKKGIWVSEYRLESGLNCGGHTFATDGLLMGPILGEFLLKREELLSELQEIYGKALEARGFKRIAPTFNVTAQGGIGTHTEHEFLLKRYNLSSVGWGTPFLLVPEATTVDNETMQKLAASGREDFVLSDVSPLGVLFNNYSQSSGEAQKQERIKAGKPGSPCTKEYLASDMEFTERPICTASRQYQRLKINQLQSMNLTEEEYSRRYAKIVEKVCLCEGLAASAYLLYGIAHRRAERSVVICPGPNGAYFTKIASLAEMTGHIYGFENLVKGTYRPHVFINELQLYVDYFKKECLKELTPRHEKYLATFKENLLFGIEYYKKLFEELSIETKSVREHFLLSLYYFESELNQLTNAQQSL